MIDYNDSNDPNYDPYWGDKETGHSESTDCPDLSGFELEELERHIYGRCSRKGCCGPPLSSLERTNLNLKRNHWSLRQTTISLSDKAVLQSSDRIAALFRLHR